MLLLHISTSVRLALHWLVSVGYRGPRTLRMHSESLCFCRAVRDRVRSKMERDILAEVNHPFIVKLHYGKGSRCGML